MADISVIIPCYNSEKYLPGTLESLRAQSFTDFEVLIVDDGSRDGSAALAEEFTRKDPRFKLLRQANAGVAAARNHGLEKAGGKYLFFVDSDDYLHPRALEILIRAAETSRLPVIECDFADTEKTFAEYQPESWDAEAPLAVCPDPLACLCARGKDYTATIWNKLYQHEAVGGLRFPDGCLFEDAAFAACLAAKINASGKIFLPLMNYFIDNTSLSRSKYSVRKILSYETGFRAVRAFLQKEKPQALETVKNRWFSWYTRVMINSLRKAKNQPDYPELKRETAAALRRLLHEGVIGWKGLSWGKKLSLLGLILSAKA